jgi:hypothetical protein
MVSAIDSSERIGTRNGDDDVFGLPVAANIVGWSDDVDNQEDDRCLYRYDSSSTV